MNLRRWGLYGALFGIAAFVGCDENAFDDVQDEQQDVIEAEQELREEEAELNQAEQEARQEGIETGTGPAFSDPDRTTPVIPPAGAEPVPQTEDSADNSLLPSTPAGEGGAAPSPENQLNEGNPDAGTEDNSDSVNDVGGTAGEGGANAEPQSEESVSEDQETAPEEPTPASPE